MSSAELNLEKAREYNKIKKYSQSLEMYEAAIEEGGI